ncbi:MAG: M13 family metallopeptidase [Pseudomonadota bacterium]
MTSRLAGLISAMLVMAMANSAADESFDGSSRQLDAPQKASALHGIDWAGMDHDTPPGVDFFRHANGTWYDTTSIEKGKWQAGALETAKSRTDERAEEIVRRIRRSRWPSDSNEAKFLAIFRNHIDHNSRRQVGLRPVGPFLSLIEGAETHDHVASLLGSYNLDAGGLISITLRLDPIEGQGYVASIEPADLLLQSRSLYLRSDPMALDQVERAQAQLKRLLQRVDWSSDTAERVAAVLDLERRLAALYPDAVSRRQPVSAEQVFGVDDLGTAYPGFPWRRFLAARGVTEDTIIQVRVSEELPGLIAAFNATPVDVWRDYLTLRFSLTYGPYLDELTARIVHRFDSARLGVEPALPTRRQRARRVATDLLPDPVGQAYVERYLSDSVVHEVEKIVDWTLLAYRERIENANWLSDDTRQRAIEKLDAIQVVVGEPPGWNNFEQFVPVRGSPFYNAYSRQQLRHRSALSRLQMPAEDPIEAAANSETRISDIFFSPISVGAYYLPTLNAIVIPAAYLQPPYYNPSASMAVNFGAVGTTIGHELGHAFDDQGAKRGPSGKISNWWDEDDKARFDAKGARLSDHLSRFDAVPGIPLNTDLTLGENLSDLAGVEIAFRALELARAAGGTDTLSKDDAQAFFISYAQKRRAKRLPTVNIDFAYSDPHSPPSVRVNGILPHVDGWYAAFDITEDDPLWLSPDHRIQVW